MWKMFQVEDVSIRDTSPNWHILKLPLHQAVYRGNSIILAAKKYLYMYLNNLWRVVTLIMSMF